MVTNGSFESSALIKPFCILANPQGSILSYRRVVFSPIIWNFQENIVSLQQELKEMSPVFRRKSEVSVLMINAQGIMISVQGYDYFLSYNRIPWMQDAPIRSVLNVQMSGPEAIEWPDLDVDLEIDSLRHPERYPLVIKRNPMDFV